MGVLIRLTPERWGTLGGTASSERASDRVVGGALAGCPNSRPLGTAEVGEAAGINPLDPRHARGLSRSVAQAILAEAGLAVAGAASATPSATTAVRAVGRSLLLAWSIQTAGSRVADGVGSPVNADRIHGL